MDFGKKTKIEAQRNTETQMSIITAGLNFTRRTLQEKRLSPKIETQEDYNSQHQL